MPMKLMGEVLERHVFSRGNYPDNIWSVDWLREGLEPSIPVSCLKEVNKLKQSFLRTESDEA